MFKLNLKIALRNLWKNKGITAINVGGLAIALAAFILVVMYATYETGFDQKNYNPINIFALGRIGSNFESEAKNNRSDIFYPSKKMLKNIRPMIVEKAIALR